MMALAPEYQQLYLTNSMTTTEVAVTAFTANAMTNVSRAGRYRVRSPSLAPSITESFEPRNPPPEYRHFISQSFLRSSSLYNYESYIQETDAEYAVDADESEEEGQPGELGLSMSTRIFDDTGQRRDGTIVAQPEDEQRSFYPIRGRRKPSTASSDIDIEVAPGSSLSSVDKSHADPASPVFGSNVKRSLQIDMKNLVGDSVANVCLFPPTVRGFSLMGPQMSISPGSRDVVLAAYAYPSLQPNALQNLHQASGNVHY